MEIEQVPELTEEQLAPGANESDSPTETQDSEAPAEPDEAPKPPRGVQKRLDELTANWRAAERREEQLRQLLAQQLAQPQPPQTFQPTQPQPTNERPVLDQFDSYEAFTEALTDWKATQAVQTALQQREAAQRQAEEQRQQQERASTWQQRATDATSRYADFQDVALNPSLPVSPAMAEVIQSVDNGPDVLYHLGRNPAEAARIAALSPAQAAFALGSLAAALQPPSKATPRPVPQPINPLAGGSAAPATDPDKMSSDQWLAWRRESLRRK